MYTRMFKYHLEHNQSFFLFGPRGVGKTKWLETMVQSKILDEVHRLIELKEYRFILTGSSAKKLKRVGTNLLAGRAITERIYPLTSHELGSDFSFEHSLQVGHLPMAYKSKNPQRFLDSYVQTYIKEEVQPSVSTYMAETKSEKSIPFCWYQ